MNDIESRIRDALRAREGDAPALDLSDARQIAGRTRRRQMLNVAVAGIGALAVVVALTAGLGELVRADRIPADQPTPTPAGTVGIALPIGYPVGEQLPDLGDAPGPLAAIWLDYRPTGQPPEAVGLVAETGTFGTLPIDVPYYPEDPAPDGMYYVALSTDGRRVAYLRPNNKLIVHDLVTGEDYAPMSEFKTRAGFTWTDATHLVGHVWAAGDGDGWVWELGTAPERVDYYEFADGFDLWVSNNGGSPRRCGAPILQDGTGEGYGVEALCDALGVIGSETLLGHWNSDRSPGDWNHPNDGNGTVVALDIHGANVGFEDPALRRVVATAGAPHWVTFATDLIGEVLAADGGTS